MQRSQQPPDASLQPLKFVNHLCLFALGASLVSVMAFFVVANLTFGRNGAPLGWDVSYYLAWMGQVVALGPLQFAASQRFVEFLYPIVASVPVYFGTSPATVELIFPPILACLTIAAAGTLALESRDLITTTLTLAFASGWFAIYRMGADFHANLLAFPLLLFASACLLRTRREGRISNKVFASFLVPTVIAAAVHIEATGFFMLVWFASFLLLGWGSGLAVWKNSATMIGSAMLVTAPFTLAYLSQIATGTGGIGSLYCPYAPYWLEVFGPTIGFSVLGIIAAAMSVSRTNEQRDFFLTLLSWSAISVAIGALAYITSFPINISDRSLLMFPTPFVSSIGLLWLLERAGIQLGQSSKWLVALTIAIPLLLVPAVYSYTAPAHFHYFPNHSPSLVSCPSNSTTS